MPPPVASRAIAKLEQPFVAALTTIAGDREVLDRLNDPDAIAHVRSVIADTMTAEAPVHAARLAKIVMMRFGFERATPKRTGQIIDLATDAQLRRGSTGIFLWSNRVDVDSWRHYRRTPAGIERKLQHIAPEEITNAMADIVGMSHIIDRDELFAVIGLIFGAHKLTPAVREHLEPVLIAAVAGGRLLRDAGRLRVSRA